MSFTVENIIAEIPAHIDEEIDVDEADELAQALSWANSCMLAMGSRAWVEAEEEYASATANTWYNLPDDFINTVAVETDDTDDYKNYTIRNRKIKFAAADDYTLTYTAYPARFTAETDTVPLQDIYLVPMGKYLAAKYLLMDSRDESSDRETSDRLMGEFYDDLNNILGTVELDNEPFQVQEVW